MELKFTVVSASVVTVPLGVMLIEVMLVVLNKILGRKDWVTASLE